MDLFKLGKDKKTGKIVEVSEVESGLNCDCVCPNCGKDLVAAQGNKTEWYFRHHESTDCQSGPEKGIQALAKEIITANSRIKLPSIGTIKYENAEADKKAKIFDFLPEVTAITNGEKLYIDIIVDDKKQNREKFYLNGNHKSIEIDLTDYVYISKDDFRKALLNTTGNKRVIYWDENTDSSSSFKISTGKLVAGLVGTGLVLGAVVLASTQKKKKPRKLSFTMQDMWDHPKDYYRYGKHKWEDGKRKSQKLWEEQKNKPQQLWEAQKDKPKQLWEEQKQKPKQLWESSKNLLDKPAELIEEGQDYLKNIGEKIKDRIGF